MIRINDLMPSGTRLALDTAPIIHYLCWAHPRYDRLVTDIFQRIVDGAITGITSALTLTEVLALPLQKQQHELCQAYKKLLTSAAHFTLVDITGEVAERAAMIRAHYHLRTPDALQIAMALVSGCQAFLTNDKALSRVPEISVLVLEAL